MSDEKNGGNTFNINAVPSCIDEPVKAVLNPGANQIGTLFWRSSCNGNKQNPFFSRKDEVATST